MITENLSTLKIHKLTQAQYEREFKAGRIDENALYLTPDTEDESANVIIDLEASNEGKANLLNADTLNGKTESSLHVAKAIDSDRLGGVLAEEYVRHTQNMPKAGFIYPLATDTIPEGFLLCDGAEYLRTEYPELFAAIGTMYGAGDGSITFNVPNLQTRVPVGAGTGYTLGATGGEATHTLTVNEMPSHTHSTHRVANANVNGGTGSNILFAGENWAQDTIETNATGGNKAHNNMQPYTVVNYIIATGKNTGVSVADIIAGAQALPLGVEYGGTGATNAEDARQNLEITPENIGAMSKELLWENSKITSVFAPQNLDLNRDLNEFDSIEILFAYSTGDTDYCVSLQVHRGVQSFICVPLASTSTYSIIQRQGVLYFDETVQFTEAQMWNGSSRVSDNKYLIPIKIYGIKGVF